MKVPKRITGRWLRRHSFCSRFTREFERYYPEGMALDSQSVAELRQEKRGNWVTAFVEAVVVYPDVQCTLKPEHCRLTAKAHRQLIDEVHERWGWEHYWDGVTGIWEWARNASGAEIVQFCTWAILNWREPIRNVPPFPGQL